MLLFDYQQPPTRFSTIRSAVADDVIDTPDDMPPLSPARGFAVKALAPPRLRPSLEKEMVQRLKKVMPMPERDKPSVASVANAWSGSLRS